MLYNVYNNYVVYDLAKLKFQGRRIISCNVLQYANIDSAQKKPCQYRKVCNELKIRWKNELNCNRIDYRSTLEQENRNHESGRKGCVPIYKDLTGTFFHSTSLASL
jgi:hypothetical protein